MELMDAIRERRAVREFADTALDRSILENLIVAATQAPSAMNLQPWAFAVLTNRRGIDDYAERAKKWLLDHWTQTGLGAPARKILDPADFTIFYHAPALVVVLATSSGRQADEDCCLAAQNLMLAARDQGIGTCWIGFARPWLDLPATKRELGLPQQYRVVAPVVLGYPTKWPEPHGRKPVEIHWLQDGAESKSGRPDLTARGVEVVLKDFDGSRTIYPTELPLQRFIHTAEIQDLEAVVGKTYFKTEETDDRGRVIYAEQR